MIFLIAYLSCFSIRLEMRAVDEEVLKWHDREDTPCVNFRTSSLFALGVILCCSKPLELEAGFGLLRILSGWAEYLLKSVKIYNKIEFNFYGFSINPNPRSVKVQRRQICISKSISTRAIRRWWWSWTSYRPLIQSCATRDKVFRTAKTLSKGKIKLICSIGSAYPCFST